MLCKKNVTLFNSESLTTFSSFWISLKGTCFFFSSSSCNIFCFFALAAACCFSFCSSSIFFCCNCSSFVVMIALFYTSKNPFFKYFIKVNFHSDQFRLRDYHQIRIGIVPDLDLFLDLLQTWIVL